MLKLKESHPIFYSFRRCPYAMRARLSLVISKTRVEIREVYLKEKPKEFLASSVSAFIYVAFNGLSVWLTATLFNNILTDFDELIKTQSLLTNSKASLNDQLKFWTNKLILRDTAIESLKVLCYTLIVSFLIKNIFLYIKNTPLQKSVSGPPNNMCSLLSASNIEFAAVKNSGLKFKLFSY